MITQQVLPYYIVQREELFPSTVDEYLTRLFPLVEVNIAQGACYPFDLERRSEHVKLNPYLRIARPQDAEIIASICQEVYEHSYPYKEIEDASYVREMIKRPQHHFILFQTESGENAGCFRCALDFEHKKGYMGGFMVRKKFQGKLDVVKAIMGSYIWMWNSFKDDILVWYCENRTAHASSQYITAICGINTVAIFPNKDIFFGKIESDVMGIIYTKKVLHHMRCSKTPRIIPAVEKCFSYSDQLYDLGRCVVEEPIFTLDRDKVARLIHDLRSSITEDQYGYRHYSFSIEETSSQFTFLHNTHIQNFEKFDFRVSSLEELFVFVAALKKEIKAHNIRYCEIFLSAYKPKHQALLYQAGFKPRGYVPCWEYQKETNNFEDCVVFNWFKGQLAPMDLLAQGQKLLSRIEA